VHQVGLFAGMEYYLEYRRAGTYYTKYGRGEADLIGHILHRNVFLKYVVEGKTEGRTEVTGRG